MIIKLLLANMKRMLKSFKEKNVGENFYAVTSIKQYGTHSHLATLLIMLLIIQIDSGRVLVRWTPTFQIGSYL